jgi:lipooligosaccharide transport system ATP-binding protein
MDEAEQLCDRLVVMDHAKIAAEGTPRDLLARYTTPEVLELRFAPDVQDEAMRKIKEFDSERLRESSPRPAGAGETGGSSSMLTEFLADRVLLYVGDGDAALAEVAALGVQPLTSLVRRSTLEDVFLRLTGRRLEE